MTTHLITLKAYMPMRGFKKKMYKDKVLNEFMI